MGDAVSDHAAAASPALVGPAAVKDMVFTARLLEVDEARSIGFLTEIVADRTALDLRAAELAKIIAGHARSPCAP